MINLTASEHLSDDSKNFEAESPVWFANAIGGRQYNATQDKEWVEDYKAFSDRLVL